jgi:hypothetical protein
MSNQGMIGTPVKFDPKKGRELREKIMKRRFEPTNEIDWFQKEANRIEHENIYNYKYTYWVATPNGMRLDDERNHKYGETRDGYEEWKRQEPQSWYADHGGVVSLRRVYDRDNENKTVGYITEEKLSDQGWKNEIVELVEQCFERLCETLNVKDRENFKYFVFNDLGFERDYKLELRTKLDKMVHVYNEYQDDEEYRAFVDKIKG